MITLNKQIITMVIARKKLAIKDFLCQAGCSSAVWRNIVAGKPIRISTVGKIAVALGVPVEQLIKQ